MTIPIRLLSLTTLLILLNGCATMSEEECLLADWHSIGYEDGARGRDLGRLSRHRQACADHGVRPDTAAYRSGRAQGLELYCTEMRGFRLGRSGGTYNGVCPAELEWLFVQGYEVGRGLYQARNAVTAVADALDSAHSEREQILDDITAMSARLVSDESTREERVTLLADIARLKGRHTELGLDIRDLEHELALREADYREAQLHSPYH
ncbi:DUF2799 domain-containing protein [Microbulbifer sp. 2201CG32-9]|uniref:DUF2799 domain-containing protein n=1 Tax=Microbulbifer sp. 2201CG32-9 TaxID=3232309 RepID=UPI00345B85A1